MSEQRPFRFGVQGRSTGPRDAWVEMVQQAESLGYATYLNMDHFVRGFDPIAGTMAAAMLTTRLRVGAFVFDNDFRHPAVLAKAVATIDVLSGGRFELGIGAGWLKEEYDQTGIPFEPAGVRIARMTEAVRLLKAIFSREHPVSFQGEHYQVTDLICPPHPVQKPHPPIMIGGGSPKVLGIAGREADIIGITTRATPGGVKDPADLTPEATEQKIAWVRDAAGDRFGEIELNCTTSDVHITDDPDPIAEKLAAQYGVTPQQVIASPHVLIGSVDEIVDRLLERRERFGFSYVVVTEPNMRAFAPVVERLAGQ
jgi:probable F420-dependent oxidoreductase